MAYKDILVHLDSSTHSKSKLALAIDLARRHKAHLTGLYVISHPHYKPELGNAEQRETEIRLEFERETGHAGIGAEWRCVECGATGVSVTEIVTMHAYCKDLVIVGQTEHGAEVDDIPADLPERLVLGAGRPVLIVPYTGNFSRVGERVLVAWRSGRESVRALGDAMPFLETADQVGVIEVDPTFGETARELPGADLTANLARHGITNSDTKITAGNIPIGDILLNHAWEGGYDLLVMGAYTRTLRGAMKLGDAAKHVLKHMTVPVLISH